MARRRATIRRAEAPGYPGPHTYDHHPAPLVDSPSAITRKALEVFGAGTLYTCLHLETLNVVDFVAEHRGRAKQRAKELAAEHDRWIQIARHLHAARALLGETKGYGVRVTLPSGPPTDISMEIALDLLAAGADQEATRLIAVDLGDGLGPFPGKLVQSRRATKTPAQALKEPTRARLAILDDYLRAAGWTRLQIADLIAASQYDWTTPPVRLALPDPSDRSQRAAKRREDWRKRVANDWIRDTLRAVRRR